MNSNKDVVSKARDVLQKYSPEKEQQFELMLHDARSTTRLMDYTLGDADKLSRENIETVLLEMRRATAEEVEAEYRDKLAAEKKRAQTKSKADRERFSQELTAKDTLIQEQKDKFSDISSAFDSMREIQNTRELAEIFEIEQIMNSVNRISQRYSNAIDFVIGGVFGAVLTNWIFPVFPPLGYT